VANVFRKNGLLFPLRWSTGQLVSVDNRGGAGGTIGMDVVAKAPPDGYTRMFGSSSVAIAASYYKKLPFDTVRDFRAVMHLSKRAYRDSKSTVVVEKIACDVTQLLKTAQVRERFRLPAFKQKARRRLRSRPISGAISRNGVRW
jgi:tripartite-type tricarboxylate transporter receptor subunit TctC